MQLLDEALAFRDTAKKRGDREALFELYRNSLWLTAKYLLGYKDLVWETHGEVFQALESPTKRKLIVMPRGTFKSSIIAVAYPIWLLIRNPNERILIDSEVYTNAKNFLREIKGHLERLEQHSLYRGLISIKSAHESELTVRQRTKNLKEASLTCGGVETTKVGQHFTCIIGDDYNSNNNSGTSEGCAKIIRHYQMNLAILEPDGVYVVDGTRYSDNDLIGHIMKNEIDKEEQGYLQCQAV